MPSVFSAFCLLPTAYYPLGVVSWALFGTVVGTAAAVVAIPIIIHLLNRQRFKVVTWAAMDFLLRAMRKNRRRMRFEQWVLLATRCTVMLLFFIAFAWLLVMLLANQAGCSTAWAQRKMVGRSGLNVFVIDNSYSTAYEANRSGPDGKPVKTHLDQEKLIAKKLIDGLNSGGESVAIITAARPATAIIAKPGFDLTAAKAAVDRIEQSFAATDLAGALQLAQKLAEDEPAVSSKNLYLLTDGTRSAWEGNQAEAIKRAGPELAKHYRITHYNMTEGRSQWNHVAADLRPATDLVTTKFPSEFLASLRGFGAGPEQPLQWLLDRAPVGGAPKSVKPDPSERPKPEVLLLTPNELKTGGPHLLEIRLGGDTSAEPLKLDNTRLRVVDVAAELKVLIVEGNRGNTALEGAGAFLQLALAPPAERTISAQEQPKSISYVAADVISDIEMRGHGLTGYRAIILCGVGQITEPEADALKRFVEAGGTLMVFMGEPVSKENYNSVLLPRKLMPGPLIKQVDSGTDGTGFLFDFKPGGVLHPFLRIFSGQENTGLGTAKVFTYWQADIPADSNVERVLSYVPAPDKNGVTPPVGTPDPAITHHALGLGHVVFFSTTAGPKWTAFPAKMAYVELMHEILAGGVRAGDYWMNLTVGQPLEIPPQVKLAGQPELRDDADTVIHIDPVTERDPNTGVEKPLVYRSRPLAKPGTYKLNLGNGAVPIVVNVPADEADVRTIGNEQVRKALGDVEVALHNDEVPTDEALSREGNDWGGHLLIVVLALLCLECFLAMAFGHYRRSEVVRT